MDLGPYSTSQTGFPLLDGALAEETVRQLPDECEWCALLKIDGKRNSYMQANGSPRCKLIKQDLTDNNRVLRQFVSNTYIGNVSISWAAHHT